MTDTLLSHNYCHSSLTHEFRNLGHHERSKPGQESIHSIVSNLLVKNLVDVKSIGFMFGIEVIYDILLNGPGGFSLKKNKQGKINVPRDNASSGFKS